MTDTEKRNPMKREVDLVAEPGERVELKFEGEWIPGTMLDSREITGFTGHVYLIRTEKGDMFAVEAMVRKPQAAIEQQ